MRKVTVRDSKRIRPQREPNSFRGTVDATSGDPDARTVGVQA